VSVTSDGQTRRRPRPPEHALLSYPRRDIAVTGALAFFTALLFVLVGNHGARSAIQHVDDTWLRWMVRIRTGWLTSVAKVLNFLGMGMVTLPIRVVIAGFLAFRRRWWHMAAFVLAIVASELCIGTLKALYDRPRPHGSLVTTSGGSFPSGHAVAASVTTVAAVIALFPEGPHRYGWGAAAVAFSGLMAASRAYLAAHWLSDAVAGLLLGTAAALSAALVVHWIRGRRERAAARLDRAQVAGRTSARRPDPP
jgi:membrane-associated phospholipid phosphatase